jgi:hypothetical protein
VLIPNKTIKL